MYRPGISRQPSTTIAMADVRALLKAKRQEARIKHPLASYNHNGQVRCIACATIVKHASAWEGHLGSKVHRTNVAQLKEMEGIREAQKISGEYGEEEQTTRGKRRAEEEPDSMETKRRRGEDSHLESSSGFPADFFSNPSHLPLPPASDDSEDEGDNSKPESKPASFPPVGSSVLDLEWEQFQRDVLNAPDHHDTYERATIFAEPELASETPEGFPSQQIDDIPAVDLPNKINEGEAARHKEQDERELIMDRLLDEERAQEEADMKVSVMKSRLDALKKRRAARKAKTNSGT